MNDTLRGRRVLVTGAASGIGKATASALARCGAELALWDINGEAVSDLAKTLGEAGSRCHALQVDITSAEDVERATKRSIELLGGLDGAFNNAGVGGPTVPLEQVAEADFDHILAVNLKGVWLCMKQQLLHMRAQKRGVIVNNASVSALVGLGGQAAYTASKHGVVGLSKAAAIEAAADGVRVNAVCPGAARTPILRHLEAAGVTEEALSGMAPMAAIPVDGGWSAQ
jgi:NAD(P)-dependent dehydrogenase (short-subunit alcohol dehydrogenase family)